MELLGKTPGHFFDAFGVLPVLGAGILHVVEHVDQPVFANALNVFLEDVNPVFWGSRLRCRTWTWCRCLTTSRRRFPLSFGMGGFLSFGHDGSSFPGPRFIFNLWEREAIGLA
ncbi:protein of unknown function [Kyrpidia spormannii]|uniref:Uncharacterized protein n=1 Tax=Kyrpidia spormannii TaxID=2055160 RepID=A0ACA8ZDG9_9BACL|nr:protein of unknown function [Kyrpidia spormannii]